MDGSKPDYDAVVLHDVMVPMQDGVRLATDVYRPARDGSPVPDPLPVILERTPYGKGQTERVQRCLIFAQRGYVFVAQDCRGCFSSEGELYFLAQEPNDGYDTVEWAARQPWCNGKVGTMGTSYMSWTQSALATQNPPHLACMFLNMGGANAYTSTVRHGGAMELRFIAWAFWHAALNANRRLKHSPSVEKALNSSDFRAWLARWPIKRGQTELKVAPNYERWAFDLLTNTEYNAFWKQPGFAIQEHWDQHADVPMYFSGGWYDSYTRATLENYVGLSKRKKSQVRVIMGPWTHGDRTLEWTYAGDVDLGPQAALPSHEAFRLRWFDRWLKGIENGVEDEAPVRIFVMGGGSGRKNSEGRLEHGGRWRDEQEWPLARTRYTPYYLHFGSKLLAHPPKRERASSTYPFDPRHPVPTVGGNFSSLDYLKPLPVGVDPKLVPPAMRRDPICLVGGQDQRERPGVFGCQPPYLPLASRPDVLVFQTPPLEEAVEVTGPLTAKLWVSSSAPDTDFTVKLVDVYPPGADYPQAYALIITDSIIRARYRNSREKPELMEPGKVYELSVTMYPTSNLFAKGHRIRVDVSSSNFPRFDVNPNTGEPLGQNRRWQVAENTLWHDAARPSHILLPVVPDKR
ncbi:MAG: CocE/NonD family hydrolase [Chloroflexi bacterium]|nr:CocE/NonD family hydrolase [Chloroflexota bacterium]